MAWDSVTDETYRRLRDLVSERRVVLERLARIEENRAAVKEAVYSKVKNEYETRKAQSDSLLFPEVKALAAGLDEIVKSLPAALRSLEAVDEEVQEIELRHSLGEFDDHERDCMVSKIRADAAAAASLVGDGLPRLKAFGELLGDFFPEFVEFAEAERNYSSGAPVGPTPAVSGQVSPPSEIPGVADHPSVSENIPVACQTADRLPSLPPSIENDDLLDDEDFAALDRLDAELMQGPCVDEQSLLKEVEGISEADLMDIEDLGKQMESGAMERPPEISGFDNPFALSDEDDDDPDSESLIDESGELGISLTSLLSPYSLQSGTSGDSGSSTVRPQQVEPQVQPPSSASQAPGPPVLIKFSEDGTNQEFPLGGDEVAIGRAADNDIVLLDKTVSRHHALISREPSGFVITDLNSTKGTFVNEKREMSKTISDGDEILIGTITFKVRIPK